MVFSPRSSIIFITIAVLVACASGFGVTTPRSSSGLSSSTSLNIFGGLKGAFANDDSLGAVENAGLKGGPNENDQVTINGKPVKAIVGQKVSVVAAAARVKIPYSCKNGDCGTCMIKMNNRKVKACQMTIPAKKCAIETL
uniref:2Fe-2S ferredoxin-type domain-containing protein n=1 Tax=Helicotheca tamesis TaxID=374047 RepID=A0A7S2HL78_9STRA|mmetsp:Transcript_18841/g.25922  ORF Transcript_18841/g.25922 Transcript_18841/m.25922 type:complete len:140 (+) Transcript_18841:153-572(+)|eukprot:CAMPEP_0185723278 /NCGR_PEP_ID=MMETSP1171-20130828/171_1 /TAXON_ID=374046 /ORGANISM="Helicotheca tamensis, Strain CCMP826" /LENGTH=139 /DNA_ID=CAMNT_0028390951 /DNA_START=140 /DNA_END=559 /DNA_ORIENTATION=-